VLEVALLARNDGIDSLFVRDELRDVKTLRTLGAGFLRIFAEVDHFHRRRLAGRRDHGDFRKLPIPFAG
jgi:hypothetical protein